MGVENENTNGVLVQQTKVGEGITLKENAKKEDATTRRASVKVTTTSTVTPKDLGRNECPLLSFDLAYLTFYYNQKVLLYKCTDFEEYVSKLKESLSVVLGFYFPLAGRIEKGEDGFLRVAYGGEENGVEVMEAVAESVELADLAVDEAPELLEEIVPYSKVMNLEGLRRPLLAVQFTKLKDGIAIGCAFNHAIIDGQSTWHFLGSWAEICRGSTTISNLPCHDRAKARATLVKLDLPSSSDAYDKTTDHFTEAKPLREKIFPFSESAISKIKSMTGGSDSATFSTFQSLGAHIWRAVTRARGPPKPEEITAFAIFVDCRRRLDPPMPETYFGNLIQAAFTGTAVGLLLAHPPDFAAGLLNQAITSHTAEVIDHRSKEWEAEPKLFYYKDAGPNPVVIGSSPRFRVYEVDFGWGKPERVRSGGNNKFNGMVYLYPSREGGKNIDVEITLEEETMAKLEKDDEFLMINI